MMSAEAFFGEKSGSVCAFGTEGRTSRRKHIEAETELAAAVFGVSRKRAQRILAPRRDLIEVHTVAGHSGRDADGRVIAIVAHSTGWLGAALPKGVYVCYTYPVRRGRETAFGGHVL